MVKAMKTKSGSISRPFRVKKELLPQLKNKELDYFFTKNTVSFFEILGMNCNFLNEDPEQWDTLEEYKNSKLKLESLAVINDCGERGVALVQNYTQKITRNEDQLQYLLQVVDDHRKKFPNANKSTLTS